MPNLHFSTLVNRGTRPTEYFGFKAMPWELKQIDKNPRQVRLYMGMEVETEIKDESLNTLGRDVVIKKQYEALNGHVVIMNDGTLQDGMEIVTTPCTFAYHKHSGMWERFFAENGGSAKHLTAWSSGRAGQHIHVSANYLTPVSLGKLYEFINKPENRDFMLKFSGREAGRLGYCPFNDRYGLKALAKGMLTDRGALNMINAKTLEFRLFRGNVSRAGIFRNLEFCKASIEFAKWTSPHSLTHQDFIGFVSKGPNRHDYPYLAGWLIKHNFLPGRAKKDLILTETNR